MKKLLSLLVLPLLLVSCVEEGLENTGNTDTPEITAAVAGESTAAVKLVSAHSAVHYKYGPWMQRSFEIRVKNLAFEKQVAIHHMSYDGTWVDIPAEFTRSLANGDEIWSATYTSRNDLGTAFCIKYTANGNTYWDNNNGANYNLELNGGALLPEGTNVKGWFSSLYTSSFNGNILVRNLAYTKDVTVVYSTDNWATTKTVKASYVGPRFYWGYASVDSPNALGIEYWTFSATLENAKQISYCISYTVNGVTYWDNNFGGNYTLTVPTYSAQ